MSVYFRVHDNKGNSDVSAGKLYDKYLALADPSDLDSNDVIYKMTLAEWASIGCFTPAAVYFRVHPDKSNRDLNAGRLYDDEFSPVAPGDVPLRGDILLLPATEDEFQVVQDFRP